LVAEKNDSYLLLPQQYIAMVNMQNKDISVVEDGEVCAICGKRIYIWEHVEHIIPYVNVHKECAKKLKIKTRIVVKKRRK